MKRALLLFCLIFALLFSLSACKKEENGSASEELFEVTFFTSFLPTAAASPESQLVKKGGRVSEPTLNYEPTAGFRVIWTRDAREGVPYDFSEAVTGAFTLYAIEVPRTYSIVYLLDGGVGVKANPTSYDKGSGTILLSALPDENCPEGYHFLKWSYFDDPDSTVEEIPQGSEGDIVLRAVYAVNRYEIQYHDVYGAVNPNAETHPIFAYGEEITLEEPTKEGSRFVGWRCAPNGEFLPNDTLTTAFVRECIYEKRIWTGIIHLYAVWEAI